MEGGGKPAQGVVKLRELGCAQAGGVGEPLRNSPRPGTQGPPGVAQVDLDATLVLY
jgi:hypothetical protein